MEPRLGIYIHIPFCASKCGYCDFYSCAGAADRMADYQHALLEHIEESAGRIAPAYIDTVYFGGGTPSFLRRGAPHRAARRRQGHRPPAQARGGDRRGQSGQRPPA